MRLQPHLTDAARFKADQEKKPEEESLVVPILMQNKLPVDSSGGNAEGHPDEVGCRAICFCIHNMT